MLSEANRLLLKLKSTDEYCYILFSAFNKIAEEGWLYLASVVDIATRCLVGYKFGATMDTDLICNALLMAIKDENPSIGTIFHSDQGSQYCSHQFQELLVAMGLRTSMSRRGQCWDNAVAESFWATLKRECLPACGAFTTRSEGSRYA